MAAQYQILDRTALLSEAVLGAGFGVLGHALHGRGADQIPTLTDAALTVKDAQHAESIGPGIPADGFSRNANVDALAKATGDVLAEQPVDVADQVAGAAFVPDPGAREFHADIAQAFAESDVGKLAAELDKTPLEAPATPSAAVATPRVARARAPIDPEADSIAVAIAKLGGLNRDEVAAEWGSSVLDDTRDLNRLAPFGKPAIRKTGGLPIDRMSEALAERGYLPVDQAGKHDVNDLYDALREEVAGNRQFTPAGQEAQGRRLAAEQAMRESDLPVTNDAGEHVTARDAFAQLDADRAESERQRRMIDAAANCEGALL